MSRWVCDDITTGGRASFTIGCGIQMERHLLSNEGVEVHVMETIPTATEGLGGVSWGTGRTRTHRNACHGTAKTWREKKNVNSQQTIWTLDIEFLEFNSVFLNWAFWPTMQCYGLSKRLQVGLHRAACLWGWWSACRHHGNSGRGASRSWRWNFATQEADEVFTPDRSSAFLNPCNHILIPALVA